MYTNRTEDYVSRLAGLREEAFEDIFNASTMALCKLYVIADRFLDKTTLKTAVTMRYRLLETQDADGTLYDLEDAIILYIFRNTTHKNRIRLLACDSYMRRIDCGEIATFPDKFKNELVTWIHERYNLGIDVNGEFWDK